jgi:hypothetical protein
MAPRPRKRSVSAQAIVLYPEHPGRLRSVGNQPDPKLIASSVSVYIVTSSADPSR